MEKYQKINSICLLVLTLIALAVVFIYTKAILVPFTLSVFITLIFSPVIQWVRGHIKLPKTLLLLMSFFLVILSFLVVLGFMGASIDSFVKDAHRYQDQLETLSVEAAKVAQFFGFGLGEDDIADVVRELPVLDYAKNLTGGIFSFLSNIFLVVIFTLFLLTGETQDTKKLPIIEEIKKNIAGYVGTKILTSFVTGVLTYLTLTIFGVEMAFMFAVLTFLLNFIPNVGSIVAVLLPMPIVFLEFGFGFSLVATLVILFAIQMTIGNVLEPKFMGNKVGLHPVAILLFLAFWGFIWGIPGMFMSVPITATLKIAFTKFELTKPVADLLSGDLSAFS